MGLNPGTFLFRLRSIITGHGFLKVIPINLWDFHLDDTVAALGAPAGSEPGLAKYNDHLSVVWEVNDTLPVNVQFHIPDDYDETNDELKLRLKAAVVNASDTPTITAAAYKDSDPTTDLAPDATAALTTTFTWVEFDLSDNGLVAGDIISIDITMGAHTNDSAYFIAAKVQYRSDLVFFDKTNR